MSGAASLSGGPRSWGIAGLRPHNVLSLGLLTFIAAMVWSNRSQAGPAHLHAHDSMAQQLARVHGGAAPADCPPPGDEAGSTEEQPEEKGIQFCKEHGWFSEPNECPQCECPDGGCDMVGKYNLKHLNQGASQDVMGPIQDDEALLLYAVVRGMRMEAVVEIGGQEGYSATNFIQAMEPFNGTMYTIDVSEVPIMHPTRHKFVHKDVYNTTAEDLDKRRFDLIFFDAHVFNAQLHLYNLLLENDMIDDETLIALHDTHAWPQPDWLLDPPQIPKLEAAEVHQPVERAMVTALKDLGWDAFSLHTPFKRHNQDFPQRHGLTLMQRFKPLSVPEGADLNPEVGTGRQRGWLAPCPQRECPDGGCDAFGKYDLTHLDQDMSQVLMGPIQDDEALVLYAVVRGMRMEAVVEIGGLDSYSAANFIQAMEPFNGTMYTIDVQELPSLHPTRHKVVQKGVYKTTPPVQPVVRNEMIDNETLIALHDTYVWPRPDWLLDPPQVPKLEEGKVHQPVERAMVNALKDLGWDAFSLHTPFKWHNQEFPQRHGLTLMQRFKPLSVPEDADLNPVFGMGRFGPLRLSILVFLRLFIMASTKNAFAMLIGGSAEPAAVASAASSKKKKSKKKANGSVAAYGPPDRAAPAPTGVAATPAPEPEAQVQSAKDAGEALEAAVAASGAGELGALATDWADQLVRDEGLFADGNDLVDFKTVLLKGRALEALVEGTCARGSVAGEARPLAQLLSAVAHPTAPAGFAAALAEAAAALGAVSAADPLTPVPEARRATRAALTLLKRGLPKPAATKAVEAPAATLRRLGGELGRAEARLGATTQPKELAKLYSSILDLLCGQLDVLRPGGGAPPPPQAPELAAALRALEELRAALATRLQEVLAPKPKLSVEQQVAQAEAAHKKEEAATSARLGEVEGRIAELEAELALLKSEAGELRLRRSAAAQHHRARVEAIRSGKQASGASPEQIAAALQPALGALEGLAVAVSGGSGGGGAAVPADAAALSGEVVAAEVPVKLLGAMQQVVELSLGQLTELGGKARFYRERLDKAVKQGEQATKLGVGDPKAFAATRATAEKNVKETLAAAEAAAAVCRTAVSAYRERLPVLLRLPSFMPPPPEYLSAMDARAAEAEQIMAAISAGTYVPPAPAPPPAAAPVAEAPAGSLAAMEARLAALDAQSVKKDAQIAAMVGSASLDVPSTLAGRTSMPPAMLSSPTSNKPIGPAADAAAPGAPIAPVSAAPGPAPAPAAPVSWASLAGPPQANGRAGRPRRA
ncbi:tRNA (guanosine(18)-2 -O)-methyltransferase isoform B [Micractinium conductrix]|uniref:tRNA (Guanosine(18)-2 -O)-methyltransferase isoform B n=1 Tax=Micractinium conductrix TaxID=554055 RepID=A0A2P6VPF9_9CHLO|nr:tRNA (guanosine(18)-2 -O)-methyltransferase isoform B [Micractinium conductrix]|eukprot:PSC75947.1 tRNA (guanosine(18)-2 -O)-methyltransferase isoform B [Micractinium conductrix]